MRDAGLWERLRSHGFPLSQGRTLAGEVSAEFGLSTEKADRTMKEYARFLYLAATEEQVVPSPFLDKVWKRHQEHHLEYRAVIQEVIGRALHNPSKHPVARRDPAYARTLMVYRQEFGQKPPIKVWPSIAHLKRARLLFIGMIAASLGLGATLIAGAETVGRVAGLAMLAFMGLSLMTSPWGTWKPGDQG